MRPHCVSDGHSCVTLPCTTAADQEWKGALTRRTQAQGALRWPSDFLLLHTCVCVHASMRSCTCSRSACRCLAYGTFSHTSCSHAHLYSLRPPCPGITLSSPRNPMPLPTLCHAASCSSAHIHPLYNVNKAKLCKLSRHGANDVLEYTPGPFLQTSNPASQRHGCLSTKSNPDRECTTACPSRPSSQRTSTMVCQQCGGCT